MAIHVIAEIGSNWGGDVELGKIHIKNAKESGASYVKFQMWRASDLYESTHPYWNEVKRSELTENVAKELKGYADKIGIKWFCSVFYPKAVDFLESVDVPLYKIASRTSRLVDKFSLETINNVAKTKKPTFISTGEGADKQKIAKLFSSGTAKFTYCISKYPTPDSEIDWQQIVNYNFFSDHTLGITIPIAYAALRKQLSGEDVFIEKHVRLEGNKGPDASFAISYDELSDLVKHLKRIDSLNLYSSNN